MTADSLSTGKSVPVLCSIRHAPQELVLTGSITTKKSKNKPTATDLCDLFVQKVRVSPKKNSSVEKVAKVTKKVKEVKVKEVKVKEVKVKDVKVKIEDRNLKATITKAVDADEATENFIKALKAIQKKPVVKPRRKPHISIGGRVSALPTGRACLSPSF
jgi:hypothetical protein